MSRTLAKLTFDDDLQQLASFAKALAHPVRLQIVQILLNQQSCFNGDLTEIIPLAQSTISQHLKALVEAGLIKGEILPPKVKYCLNRKNWEVASALFGSLFGIEKEHSMQNTTCCR